VRTVSADLDISPDRAWTLYARPDAWRVWAPYLRGASGLTTYRGEVRAGARGVVWVGVAPVPAEITWVDRGRSWSWRIGPVEMDHVVEPRGRGCRVALVFRGPPVVEGLCAAIYGTPAQLFLRNMGRVGRRPLSARASGR
jgi:hypothetical protein